jgi:hypothetical protein
MLHVSTKLKRKHKIQRLIIKNSSILKQICPDFIQTNSKVKQSKWTIKIIISQYEH